MKSAASSWVGEWPGRVRTVDTPSVRTTSATTGRTCGAQELYAVEVALGLPTRSATGTATGTGAAAAAGAGAAAGATAGAAASAAVAAPSPAQRSPQLSPDQWSPQL